MSAAIEMAAALRTGARAGAWKAVVAETSENLKAARDGSEQDGREGQRCGK